MSILIETKEQKEALEKIKKLPTETKCKRWGNGKISQSKKIDYVNFFEKSEKKEILLKLFDSLENRYQILKFCLENIKKECENITEELDKSKIKKEMKAVQIKLDFMINCEYFIFSLGSDLDIIAILLNKIYNLGLKEESVTINKIYGKMKNKRDSFSCFYLKARKKWIEEFKEIRNKMTHYQIVSFSSQDNCDLVNNKRTYNKHCISVITNKDEKITKVLPIYFEDLIKNFKEFKDEFYKKLNKGLK